MLRQRRPPLLVRSVACVAALAVLSAGSGAPMCANLFTQALEPCAMHVHRDHARALTGGQVTAQQVPAACHPGELGAACASGGTCPSGGPLAASLISTQIALVQAAPERAEAPLPSLRSFVAPPLAPPPQG